MKLNDLFPSHLHQSSAIDLLGRGLLRTWESGINSDENGYIRLPMHHFDDDALESLLNDEDYSEVFRNTLAEYVPDHHLSVRAKSFSGPNSALKGKSYWFKLTDASKVRDKDRELMGVLDL